MEIKALNNELETGKLSLLKEEEVKSRFIQTFFGEILGFSCEGAERWHLREEKKSQIDGTKADAALGYFSKIKKDVRAVIEMKNGNTSLDEEQKRQSRQTPIAQAFEYAAKMGGNCQWVIVSNMIETRFYPSLDQSKYQVFFLHELRNEEKLKELLFLFHKDRFIREDGPSGTHRLFEISKQSIGMQDKPLHIIDQMYNSLERFDGFGYIDPDYISTIKPFNILEDHVWHYKDRELFTLNPLIYEVLKEITIEDDKITFSSHLEQQLADEGVFDAHEKIVTVFRKLQHYHIEKISAIKDYKKVVERNKHTIGFSRRIPLGFKEGEEGITKNFRIQQPIACECLSCIYRSLDFERLLSKLKTSLGKEGENTLEYAFGHYLVATNNFKTAYTIYQFIASETKGKQGKGLIYFLARLNTQLLYNLVSDYHLPDSREILEDIKSIDLNKVIHEELEFEVDKEVKSYLLKVKEYDLIYELQDEIIAKVEEVQRLKQMFDGQAAYYSGPDHAHQVFELYFHLYKHINGNFIIYDTFNRYKSLTKCVFQALVLSYQTRQIGLHSFNSFFIMEAVLHIPTRDLQEILANVDNLEVDEDSKADIIKRLTNFTTSYFKTGLFGDPYPNSILQEQMQNFRFKDKFANIFSNLFTVLARLELTKEQFQPCKRSLMQFLKIERELRWFDLKELCVFIYTQAHLFESSELVDILYLAINGDKYGFNKYTKLIEGIPKALSKRFPEQKITRTKIIQTAILKSSADDGHHAEYIHLIPLVNVCNEECRLLLFDAFEEYLNKNFQPMFYEELLIKTDYDYRKNIYFEKYVDYINTHKGDRSIPLGKYQFTDLVFINFVLVLYRRDIDFKMPELKRLTNLGQFETWLLNPNEYDYTTFDAKWLIDLHGFSILGKLSHIQAIAHAIEIELSSNFNSILAEIKYKYFQQQLIASVEFT